MHTGGSSLCDAPAICPAPGPKAGTAAWAYLPSRRSAWWRSDPLNQPPDTMSKQTPGASMHRSGQTTTHEAPRAPHGHDNRTPHGIDESARSPSEAASSQPAHRTSARRPGAQTRNASRQPHRRNPTGSLRARPTPPRLGSEDSPTVALEQGARKLFREAQGAPRKTRAHPRFAFAPCAAAFPQAPSAPQGAPRGRAPTRGDRQPWERASTRGRTRQSART